MADASGIEESPGLTTFQVREGYVYAPIPPATSYGHRAEMWDVERWQAAVRVRVVTRGDEALVRLEQLDTGELFAECPLPSDGTSLTTAVDPVVDSSRYFVIRVEDRTTTTRQHAFIGLGFRKRSEASDFTAALDDYRQYLRRKREAEAMRHEFEQTSLDEGATQQHAAQEADTSGGSAAPAPGKDFSLKPGQTLKLNLSAKARPSATSATTTPPPSFLARAASLKTPDTAGVLKLPPPPAKPMLLFAPEFAPDFPEPAPRAAHTDAAGSCSSSGSGGRGAAAEPAAAGGAQGSGLQGQEQVADVSAESGKPRLARPSLETPAVGVAAAAATAAAAAAAELGGAGASGGDDDGWGDFQG